jgi:flagellar protein FlaF
MSLRAYQQASARAEKPRESEYRLFGQVTRALIEASRAAQDDLQTRIDAIDWNRRLWSALANDCAQPENQLPTHLRAQIISLSSWVRRYSSSVMRDNEPFDPLIDINRIMMQGLDGKVSDPTQVPVSAH